MNKLLRLLENPPRDWTMTETYELTGSPETARPLWLADLYQHTIQEEPAVAGLWLDAEGLHMSCAMQDAFPHSDAKAQGDSTWEKGDVLELFLMPEADEKSYFEFHITPNQATLELSIPDAEKLRNGEYPFETLFVKTGMKAFAETFNTGKVSGWIGTIHLPPELLQKGSFKFAVCRYNYPEKGEPALSASCAFPIPRFHLPEMWHRSSVSN